MLAASYLGCVSSHRSKPRDFGTAEERCGSNTTTAEIGCTEQYADARRGRLLWSEAQSSMQMHEAVCYGVSRGP